MHRDTAIAFAGNADIDFVRGMIPRHWGAIEMARVALQFGTNEQTKKWANEIIAAQERKIVEMRKWLVRNPRQSRDISHDFGPHRASARAGASR
jgi:uncharacterized protein (DUF305 family)